MTHYIGLDLGGTNVKAGVVDENGCVRSQLSVPTNAIGGQEAVIAAMVDAARQVAAEAGLSLEQIAGIGIGAPGPLDLEAGVVSEAPNIPGWQNVPLRARIAEATGRPSVLENDANAAAFGEFWAGAGRNPSIRHLVMLTLGTGIGSGLIVDGKLIHGAHGIGAEGGHTIVQPGGRICNCGQRGCLEAYASASNTACRAQEAIDAGRATMLTQSRSRPSKAITAKDVFAAAATGDELAKSIIDDTALYLGIACVNFCRLFDPQMIVFAGGMMLAGDTLFAEIRRVFEEQTWSLTKPTVRIVPAELGNDAGFIGAAAVAWDADQAHLLS